MIVDAPAPHTARNSSPILEVLRREFADVAGVLEIGSGDGQHAVTFAAALPHLIWQTSDLDDQHAAIRRRLADAALPNTRDPLSLDVLCGRVPAAAYDALFSANTAHIMSLEAVRRMFRLAGLALRPAGIFCLYGPFRQNGKFNAASNASFDSSLRKRNFAMGIRDLEQLDEYAMVSGLLRSRLYAMPSNNHLAVWVKNKEAADDYT